MVNKSKDKNYFNTQQILEIIKWAFNNENANFLYMSFHNKADSEKITEPKTEPKFLKIKDRTDIFVSSNLMSFVNEMMNELGWQMQDFEEEVITSLTIDVGVAHSQNIEEVYNDEYNKTSKTITFSNSEEIYNFAETVSDEIEAFVNEQTLEDTTKDLSLNYKRLKSLTENGNFDFILSLGDAQMLDSMKLDKGKKAVHRVKENGKEKIVITDSKLIM